jgi:TolB-like protein/tetratricopeptide (TPR) repeat protein
MSAEHDQQYLGDGIAEELLNALATIDGLAVAARTSSFSFHGRNATMQEIGEVLHVRHVLEGSVRRSGQKLRVTAQLVDVQSGFHLFSQSYDRDMRDIFDIQNEIARQIVHALMPKLGLARDATLVEHGTRNLEAYNLWLKAHWWVQNPDFDTLETALGQLQGAVRLERTYADAWSDMAYVYAHWAAWSENPVAELVRASNAATTALLNVPDHPMALIVQARLSMLVDRDAQTAARLFEQARASGAELAVWAFNKAYFLDGPLARYGEAIAYLIEAVRKDPRDQMVRFALADMYLASGRVDEAVAEALALQQLRPLTLEAWAICGRIFAIGGDIARARAAAAGLRDATLRLYNTGSPYVLFAIAEATGEHAEAAAALEEFSRQNPDSRPLQLWLIGEGHKALGQYEQALHYWTRAVDRHEVYALTRIALENRDHPVIGKDPRFLVLLKRLGLAGSAEEAESG